MNKPDTTNEYQVEDIQDTSAFNTFIENHPTGIALIPEPYGKTTQCAFHQDAGDFAKWLRTNEPSITLEIKSAEHRIVLRSHDIWLPLIYIAENITLPIILGLVSSYVYDRCKGALKGDKCDVHLKIAYKDKKTKSVKILRYNGNVDGLQKVVKQIDHPQP